MPHDLQETEANPDSLLFAWVAWPFFAWVAWFFFAWLSTLALVTWSVLVYCGN